jgi:hypothetical protein
MQLRNCMLVEFDWTVSTNVKPTIYLTDAYGDVLRQLPCQVRHVLTPQPTLVVMLEPIHGVAGSAGCYCPACPYWATGDVVHLRPYWTDRLSDAALHALIAHELAHCFSSRLTGVVGSETAANRRVVEWGFDLAALERALPLDTSFYA